MTGRNTSSPDSVLHLLKEAGVDEDPALLEAVGQIAELAERPAPEPSAELAQLMASGGKAASGRLTKGRITFIGGALAVSMGVGMSGVAAGPAERHVELDGSIDSVTRFWARDHVDRVDAGSVAGPRAAVPLPSDGATPLPSDTAGLHFSDEAAQVPPASVEGVLLPDEVLGAGGSEVGADLSQALPAGHLGIAPPSSAPAPSAITGATVPSPFRQSPRSPHGGVVAAPNVPAPSTVDAHRWDPRTSGSHGSASISGPYGSAGTAGPRGGSGIAGPQGGAGTSGPEDGAGAAADGAGGTGVRVPAGVAEFPKPADDIPRHVEEPVRFATLAWVDEGPDEYMSDAAQLMLLRTPGAAPENVVFFSASMSGDGQWLALFVPDVTEPTRDPATVEYVPGKPESEKSLSDSLDLPAGTDSSDGTGRSPHAVPDVRGEGPVAKVPGFESPPEALDGESEPGIPTPDELSEGSAATASKHSGPHVTSAEEEPTGIAPSQKSLKEPAGTAPSQKPSADPAREDEPGEPIPAVSSPAEFTPTELVPAEPTPTPAPTSVSHVPMEQPSGVVPATGTPEMSADELSLSPSEVFVDEPIGVLPEPEGVPAG